MKAKQCKTCLVTKEESNFWKQKAGDGRRARCIQCLSAAWSIKYQTDEKTRKRIARNNRAGHLRLYSDPIRREKKVVYQNAEGKKSQNKPVQRHNKLKNNYGISLAAALLLLESQNGCCKICGVSEADYKQDQIDRGNKLIRSLAIDHCHKTKKIRGILCDNCNRGIGHFKENLDLLRKAIEYLALTSAAATAVDSVPSEPLT